MIFFFTLIDFKELQLLITKFNPGPKVLGFFLFLSEINSSLVVDSNWIIVDHGLGFSQTLANIKPKLFSAQACSRTETG